MDTKIMNEYLKTVLCKQCEIVGADYNKIDFKKENWFWDYECTADQEAEFKLWLMDYMKINKDARKELMNIPSTNKRFLEKFANEWIFQYGWKTKKNEK